MPGGPAHKYLEPGDVLVRVNGDVSRSIFLFIILSTNFCCHLTISSFLLLSEVKLIYDHHMHNYELLS